LRIKVSCLGLVLLAAVSVSAETVTVSSRSDVHKIFGNNPYYATSSGNDATSISFASIDGRSFTFSATGTTNCGSGCPSWGPDGNPAMFGSFNMPLMAVFLSDTFPVGGLSELGNTSSPSTLSPLLGQVFFLGDGWTGLGVGVGTQQIIYAPTGATHLYFGLADVPSLYGDNFGSLSVDVSTQVPSTETVPEPSGIALLGSGLLAMGTGFRRKFMCR
jgi:hypothetical protein